MLTFDRDYIERHLGLEDLSTIILQETMKQLGERSLESVQLTADITVFPTERGCVGYWIVIGGVKLWVHKYSTDQ
ncbi:MULTISPECIES: hypothetical protein [Bacillus cereus group]|uniref:hypothetical protein n=1 Tax=Bacillus cereus group TaxID=86661 RepID=UPI00046F3CF4|nr:hypothetical protein [Bacillus cereus]MDA2445425.1 hypothetical protein [Bacillus cereus]HDR6217334.1 hypothetical protein [Bacillus cereus]HDR6219697.1 hypothetical protein [Bacillus cereus]HDR6956425.1 hypothetical protein [Bacillus cereus]